MFIGRTDAKAEVPILWPTDTKSWLIRRDPDAGKDWKQEDKGTTKDEMVRGYHRLSGHEFEQTLGDGEGQGSLACCSPWGHKESDTTEWLKSVADWVDLCFWIMFGAGYLKDWRAEMEVNSFTMVLWWPFVGPHRKALFNLRWLILWQHTPQVFLVQTLISSFLKNGTRWFSLPPSFQLHQRLDCLLPLGV